MELELKYCPKCKRKTIQVKVKRINHRAYDTYRAWEAKAGRNPDSGDRIGQYTTYSLYCPQCGFDRSKDHQTIEVITEKKDGDFELA